MFEVRKYKVGVDIWGLILFLIIMIPNFIWFVVPAPNDVMRIKSITPTIDMIASVFQVAMVGAMCILKNIDRAKAMRKELFIGIVVAILLYFGSWILYYNGIVNAIVILAMCIFPCIAFILFSLKRKNAISLLSALVFMICHVIFGILNFIV